MPQLLGLCARVWSPNYSAIREATGNESPVSCNEEQSLLTATRDSPRLAAKTQHNLKEKNRRQRLQPIEYTDGKILLSPSRSLRWGVSDTCHGSTQGTAAHIVNLEGVIRQRQALTFQKTTTEAGPCCSTAKSCLTFCDPWTAALQPSLSFTISQSLLKLMSIESVMPPAHLILCLPLLLSLPQHQSLFQ